MNDKIINDQRTGKGGQVCHTNEKNPNKEGHLEKSFLKRGKYRFKKNNSISRGATAKNSDFKSCGAEDSSLKRDNGQQTNHRRLSFPWKHWVGLNMRFIGSKCKPKNIT